MEAAVCVSGVLLILFSTGAQLSPDPKLVLGSVGGNATFKTWSHPLDYCLLYRVSADADLLLAKCSGRRQPDGPKPDGYEVECDYSEGFSFVMSNLTMSHIGHYRTEGWSRKVKHINFRLIVCAEGDQDEWETVYDDGSAVVCRMDSTLRNGSSLQVHRFQRLVLDTNSSLEPLEEDLRGRLQVDFSSSLVALSGVKGLDGHYRCTVWRGAQCHIYKKKTLFLEGNPVFAHAGENITLPCVFKGASPLGKGKVGWATPTGRFKFNMTVQQEVMYRSQTGNYSLLIPSVSQQHSGKYKCQREDSVWKHRESKIQTFYLYVCPLVSPLNVMFSHGESVHLNYTPHLDFSSVDGIMWYRQKVLEPQVLILDSRKGSASLIEDLSGRVSLRGQVTWRGRETKGGKLTEGERLTNSPLILSNLTAEDSGLYTWRVYQKITVRFHKSKHVCFEGSIRLVSRGPYAVHSPFYRVYVPLTLLGLVAAVIWFSLKSRRGEQTSGRQSREGQQSGDEDLHEEVEMAEISG